MKKIPVLLFLLFLSLPVFAQTVPLDSVAYYDGKTITVCANVSGSYTSHGEHKVMLLNFGNPYPNHSFSVAIFEKDWANFSYTPATSLKGKDICVTGKVKIYKGKPEIIVDSEEQITVP